MNSVFLSAEWRKLIMANYIIDPHLLKPLLPAQTELDLYKGACYLSLVGFRFLNTRLRGFSIPFHTHFEEVNLRFYVRFKSEGEWKRGTVFIKELVPKHAISFVANTIYDENYETRPMKHTWEKNHQDQAITYAWKLHHWHTIHIKAETNPIPMLSESEEAFIAEHYWGLSKSDGNKTYRYKVEHPEWQVYKTIDAAIEVDFKTNYGLPFSFLNQEKPASVFLAEGSAVEVMKRQLLV